MEREKIEYQHSYSKDFTKIAMPGLVKDNNIALKRGKLEKDFVYDAWLEEVANEKVNGYRVWPSACLTKDMKPWRPGLLPIVS
jgi:hypothetical protein